MHIFLTLLLGGTALLWLLVALDIALGVPRIPRLADAALLCDQDCPRVSILFAARDEAEKLPAALKTLLALDYPDYEVIAVDDRSEDATQKILQEAAAQNPHLKIVRVNSLPVGWLGKPHALQRAFEESSGEWLVFTDADVHFAPDVLRRALAIAREKDWEHMPLMANVLMDSSGEKIALTYFGFAFTLAMRPWRVSMPRTNNYVGVGAFQMIRRSTYQKLGMHRALKMEVVDDVKLGKLAKLSGARSGVGLPGNLLTVRWHAGLRNIIRGTTKNFFAAGGFRLWVTCAQILGTILLCVVPFAALPFARGWALAFAAIACAIAVVTQAGVSRAFGVEPVYALAHPIGALLMTWMVARSAFVTLRQGGIVWRGTFYPLNDLRRGMV
ncbi:MAG TPA: glycosyltransferase family 2 protein [Candidatus Acidoferrales bacterium]|nr:glycosyltransferase family 2 protein [Candidatus Acidoferrales bacterium]